MIDYNETKCKEIINLDLKQNCISHITLIKIENEKKSNISECNNLLGEEKIYCENIIKNKTDLAFLNEAIEIKNINKCEEIKNLNLKNTCLDSINLENAITNNDIKLCEQIKDIDKNNNCLNSL
jgi:hypothetical protein